MKFDPHTVQSRFQSPLGPITLAVSPLGLCGLWFDGQQHGPDASAWPAAPDGHALLAQAKDQLRAYFAGDTQPWSVPLDLRGGTPFQQDVWRSLLTIPRGQTTSYGALSERIGHPAAVRALGAAVGRNPVSIVVPCHRVLGKNGALTGYAGGLDRKAALLKLEGAI